MEEEKILENITNSISSRLKVPIITTYICVLFLYNWDILFYIFFDEGKALEKIHYIKTEYSVEYFERVLIALSISVVLITLFTVINTALNFCLKWFYRKDKEMTSEIESYEKINVLSEQLSKALNDIKSLTDQLQNARNINEKKQADTVLTPLEISKQDYNNLLKFIDNSANKQKLKYSLKELIDALKKDANINVSTLYEQATYEADMKSLISHLGSQNLLKVKSVLVSGRFIDKFDISKTFMDFMTME